ncbi:MAG: protein-tyrosine-phosphatase [Acidobacteria bacterium]|nr:protein-tyrosine-phosphatase [Acidobacteriota bacterium]
MQRRWAVLLIGIAIAILHAAEPAPGSDSSWSGVGRVVAVGDIHGDYSRYVELLQAAGILDRKANWKGGKAHLVQIGDIPDRGPHPRKLMDLLMKLEKQAGKAGGFVHVLIGNHEAMNVYGDLRYTTPAEYEEFRTGDSERIRQAFLEREIEARRKQAEAEGQAFEPDEAFRREWEEEHPLGYFEHRFAYGPNGKYGQWIRSRNVVIRIDDSLFVHGGIGPKYADFPPDAINDKVRGELADYSLLEGGFATDREGPLWYRGLAQGDELELGPHVDAVLKHFGVRRIVIGHTPTRTTILPRFEGKVILADVGLSGYYGGPPACVIIEKGKPYALHRGQKLAIPSDGGVGLLAYLRSAAALDPSPSPIQKVIEELQSKLQSTPAHPHERRRTP